MDDKKAKEIIDWHLYLQIPSSKDQPNKKKMFVRKCKKYKWLNERLYINRGTKVQMIECIISLPVSVCCSVFF